MGEYLGVATDVAGLSPTVEPASSLAGFAASIPNADDPANDPLYRIGLVRNGIERSLATLLQFRAVGRDPKCGGYVFAEIPDWVLLRWHDDLVIAAQAIEARSDETEGLGPRGESAVRQDAPVSPCNLTSQSERTLALDGWC